MSNRQPQELLASTDIDTIHAGTMKILSETGIAFPSEPALQVFKNNGYRVEDQVVFFDEGDLMALLGKAPSAFRIHARNPEHDVHVGDGSPVLAPGYGAPFLADRDEGVRKPTLENYRTLVRLAHALPNQDLSGHLLVQPDDVAADVAHLHMLHAHLLYSDKPFVGSTEGKRGARQTLELTALAFEQDVERLAEKPAFIGLINTLSPLRFSEEMIAALLTYAAARQPVIVAAATMAGSTGPITLPAMLVQQNAEILAGIALAQLVAPGTPVVYGSTSTNMDMRTGAMAIGSPELSLVVAATAQLARRYGLPSRSGGALSDAHTADARAGSESAFSLLTAFNSGIDLILHSAGILSSFLVFSREKFVLDDDLCGMARRYRHGLDVNDETLGLESIANTAHQGNYLKDPMTIARCRTEFWSPDTFMRDSVQNWIAGGMQDAMTLAALRADQLLSAYVQPPTDPAVEQRINAYIEKELQQ
ncbi:MAG: trimethylamine methyltransferase family protein [Anaerolineales bacterium]|nr:trimethylamine methyltransferase family protein [Anaerolineales bacterium]